MLAGYWLQKGEVSLTSPFLLFLRIKIRLIEGNAKCRHLKKFTCKGTLRQVVIRVYRLEIANFLCTVSHVGIFDLALWTVAPLSFSLVQLSAPLPPSQYKQTMCGWEGVGGVESCWRLYIFCRSFNTLYLTRFKTYKTARQPETKTKEGRGTQTDKHLQQSPFTGQLFRRWHFALVSK